MVSTFHGTALNALYAALATMWQNSGLAAADLRRILMFYRANMKQNIEFDELQFRHGDALPPCLGFR
jgi:hypothetical protein